MNSSKIAAQFAADGLTKHSSYFLEVRDREQPEKHLIAWLHVTREERYERAPLTGDILGATLEFRYERLWPSYGTMQSSGDFGACLYPLLREGQEVCLTTTAARSVGAVYVSDENLRGHRVGTYFMNEIVSWVKQWPDAQVRSIELVKGDATPDNKERRNQLYEQFGIEFLFGGAGQRAAGLSKPMQVSQLHCVDTAAFNIFRRETQPLVAKLLDARHQEQQNMKFQQRLNHEVETELMIAREKPLRWICAQWFRKLHRSIWS